MRFGSLFSGIGGLDLGLERAGMTCAWQVEIDEWCRAVLERHWPDVPRFGDIRETSAAFLDPVDLICGGFPCQPVSLAGKRRGQDDERWLWPEFARIVRVLRPLYVLVENVPGLLARGMGDVLGDLAASGYDTEWDCIPAAAVGAPHLRYRVFVIAYQADSSRPDANGLGSHRTEINLNRGIELRDEQERQPRSLGTSVADADRERWQGRPGIFGQGRRPEPSDGGWWTTESDIRRMVDGISEGLDGGVDGGHRVDSTGGTPRQSEDCLRAVWFAWTEVGTASHGRGSDEQLTRQLANALPRLPHPHPLGDGQASLEAARFMQGLRQTCSQVGALSDPRQPTAAAWQSLSEEDQAWVGMALGGGPFVSEWPGVPRISKGVPSRMDRLRGLGNAVVPQIAEWIGRRLMEMDA